MSRSTDRGECVPIEVLDAIIGNELTCGEIEAITERSTEAVRRAIKLLEEKGMVSQRGVRTKQSGRGYDPRRFGLGPRFQSAAEAK